MSVRDDAEFEHMCREFADESYRDWSQIRDDVDNGLWDPHFKAMKEKREAEAEKEDPPLPEYIPF